MQKDYSQFSSDDFIADEYFQRWTMFPDEENNEFWEKWLSDHPEKRDEVMKASLFLSHLQFQSKKPDKRAIEISLAKNLGRIQMLQDDSEKKKNRNRKYLWFLAAAGIAFFFYTGYQSFLEEPVKMQIVNTGNEIRSVMLPDSTNVTLNANSSIHFASDLMLSVTKEVWLKGEGFFQIKQGKKNEDPRKFIVHSGELNVETTNTAFNIKRKGDVTSVTLNDGSITIHLQDENGSLIYLRPGDFFQYSKKERYFRQKKVNAELYSCWKDKKMKLDKVPLAEIAQLLQDSYGYKVIMHDERMVDQRVSGMLLTNNEEVLLKSLATNMNIDITKKDSLLTFQSQPKK